MFRQILRCIKELDENDIIRGKTDKARNNHYNFHHTKESILLFLFTDH